MNFDAAIFDLDGTLLDTLGVWDGILAAPLERRGLPCPPDYVERVHSLSFEEAAEYTVGRFALAEPPGTFLREWDELALGEYAHRVRMLPGAREYLAALRRRGVVLAVATSLPERLYRPCLDRLGITGSFSALCSTDETAHGKSEPDVFLLAAERLGVPPERCAVFDDSATALRAAERAGMTAIAARPEGFKNAPLPGELWDLYDENRTKTGLTMRRGDAVPAGLYHLSVSGWIADSRGRILLTQRAAQKSYPLLYECTGGCVCAREDSLTAIRREIFEELGLDMGPAPARLIYSARREEDFYDAYLFPAPDPLPAFVLQREEVADAKWVTFGELLSMRSRGELHPLLDYCGILGAYFPARGG